MQITRQSGAPKLLLLSLLITGLVIITVTYLSKQILESVTDLMYVQITGILLALTLVLTTRFRGNGIYGRAWLLFLGAMSSWFIAESLWSVNELVYHDNPFPSIADVFYIAGYPFMLLFLINYLKPVRKAITKKMIMAAIAISVSITVPSIYMSYSFDPKVSALENVLATAYPIADAVIFVPAIIGIALFFRGEVNFTWSLICIGILCSALGDTGFQAAEFTGTYYTGHPADIILMWSYLFYAFGVYDHIKLFRKDKIKTQNHLSK